MDTAGTDEQQCLESCGALPSEKNKINTFIMGIIKQRKN